MVRVTNTSISTGACNIDGGTRDIGVQGGEKEGEQDRGGG